MNTEIIINGTSVPYLPDTGIGINKKINDEPANIGSRSGDSTYTISIPGSTEGVRNLFNNLFDVNVSQEDYSLFTPARINTRLKAPAQIYQNQLLVFSGYARLNDIILSERGKIVFEVVFYSELPDLFATIGEKYLNELDLSAYNHEYNVTNIANSWDTSIIENGSPVAFELGKGYVYPMIEYGENNEFHKKPNNWYWHHFKPAVYAKTIVDAIFSEAGIAYSSEFFESEYFKKLIIPYTNGDFRISADEVTARQFLANRVTTDYLGAITNTRFNSVSQAIIFNNDVTDPSNQYNTTTGVFTAANDGTYRFGVVVTGRFKYVGAGFNAGASNSPLLQVKCDIEVLRTTSAATTIGTGRAITIGGFGTLPSFSTAIVSNGDFTNEFFVQYLTPEIFLTAGETVFVAPIRFFTTGQIPNSDLQIEIDFGSSFLNQVDAQYNYNDTIILSDTLPDNFKQKEFLAGIIKMFNLYFDTDPTRANTLIVEPRPSFYQDTAVDLTNVFDIEEPYNPKPQGLAKYKSYLLTYSQDNDFFNADYTNRTNETYGQLRVGIANEFVGDEYKVELPFAPTPLISQQPTDRALSAIFFKDANGTISQQAAKPRILFYGGLIETQAWRLWDSTTSTTYTEYPYAGHHDTPYLPENDLLYFPPKLYYYGGVGGVEISITNQNLYALYYYQHLQEINSEDAFTASASFNIQPDLFLQMTLRKLYFFQNAYWRLLEMEDYSLDPIKVTKCQFVKALLINAPPPVVTVVNGGNGPWEPIPGDEIPTPGLIAPPPQGGNGSFGPDNTMPDSGRGVLAVGTNVVLGDNVDSVVVLGGNQVVIPSDIKGGIYINSDFTDVEFLNQNPASEGLVAISGDPVFVGGTINVSGDTMFDKPVSYKPAVITTADSPHDIVTPCLICLNTSGDINVYLPDIADLNGRNKQFVITKRNAADLVNVYAQGGAVIYHNLGNDNPFPLSDRQSIFIIYDGLGDWQVISGP